MSMTGCSNKTVISFRHYFRQLVSEVLDTEDSIIGGEGIEVEIDEAKMGKRKYNRGHRVEGVWIIGGVERTAERKIFLIPVEDRSSATISSIVSTHVRPGSVILTDLWKGYACIQKEFDVYDHITVNHSMHFKDPDTGAHTNTIEGTWNGLKMKIKPRNRNKDSIDMHLFEFIWRRKHKDQLWNAILHALANVYYD
jgi:hypothetical protein